MKSIISIMLLLLIATSVATAGVGDKGGGGKKDKAVIKILPPDLELSGAP